MKFVVSILSLWVLAACSKPETANDPLAFPKSKFETYTIEVTTTEGVKQVVYKAYMHIPYVAKPVDSAYHSLNVFEPISIDEKEINTANEPIFFMIGVGGYMSVNNARSIGDLNPKKDESGLEPLPDINYEQRAATLFLVAAFIS